MSPRCSQIEFYCQVSHTFVVHCSFKPDLFQNLPVTSCLFYSAPYEPFSHCLPLSDAAPLKNLHVCYFQTKVAPCYISVAVLRVNICLQN